MKLEKNNIINLIKQNMNLFGAFDEVYVFGSILDSEKYSNDIDILLLYSNFSYGILASISSIIKCIEHLTGLYNFYATSEVDEASLHKA